MNLFTFLNRQMRFSKATFGPTPRTEGILRHIEKEINEIRQNPTDLTEWVDVAILALDGAWRAGYTPYQICAELERKQAVNMGRSWDVRGEDEPCEHVDHSPAVYKLWQVIDQGSELLDKAYGNPIVFGTGHKDIWIIHQSHQWRIVKARSLHVISGGYTHSGAVEAALKRLLETKQFKEHNV